MTTIQEAQNTDISAEQIKSFLRSHPNFFEANAHLLTEISLPSPHGSGVISLAERQQLALRDKIRVIEAMMAKMIKHAEENDVTSEKVHRFSVRLLNQQSFAALQKLIADTLQLDFGVSQSMIRIWLKPSNRAIAQDAVFTPVTETFSDWVIGLEHAHCGAKPELADDLLAPHLQSYAFIPLRNADLNQHPFGVLILGAEDQQRFKADMGTLYLDRIGELSSAALLNHLFALQL